MPPRSPLLHLIGELHLREAGQLPWAEPYERQGSEVLTGVTWADGLLEIPEHSTHPRGAILRYWSFAQPQA